MSLIFTLAPSAPLVLMLALCALAFILLVGWPLVAILARVAGSVILAAILTTLAVPAAASTGSDLLTALTPSLLDLAGVVLTALIGLATVRFQRWTGIQIEARHREALHSAIMTAARLAVVGNLAPDAATRFVSSYVRESVPDALKRLAPSADTLDVLVRSRIVQAAEL
ncbi:hypothetical protein U5903_22380 [Cereibacter johrii]|uniref:hypothetical protein n=1 Tax=Cereibacter johrii TaxID=445629 RepID=UPI002B1FCE19|nr:hypothetical protein [Cereibacter johrii]MEA5163526.1 hypothetical protein [Cereibacter johrii]